MRNWAVGVGSAVAVVAGVVVVQSGISGSALPILPHRSATAAEDGPDLPAPAEVTAPPPAAGAVRQVPATRVAAVAVPHPVRPRAGHPAAKPAPPAKEPAEPKDKDGGKEPAKDGAKDSGKDDGKTGPGKEAKPGTG